MGLGYINDNSKEIILNVGGGVRLQGFFSKVKNSKPEGIVILITLYNLHKKVICFKLC